LKVQSENNCKNEKAEMKGKVESENKKSRLHLISLFTFNFSLCR